MSKTKGDIVLLALRRAGIASSATLTQPEPQSIADALDDLELYIAELEGIGVHLGYNFSPEGDPIDPDSESGLQSGDVNAIGYNMARRILIDNLRPIPDELANAATTSYEAMLIRRIQVHKLQRRNDMPVGAGNKPFGTRDRFYIEQDDLSADGNSITI